MTSKFLLWKSFMKQLIKISLKLNSIVIFFSKMILDADNLPLYLFPIFGVGLSKFINHSNNAIAIFWVSIIFVSKLCSSFSSSSFSLSMDSLIGFCKDKILIMLLWEFVSKGLLIRLFTRVISVFLGILIFSLAFWKNWLFISSMPFSSGVLLLYTFTFKASLCLFWIIKLLFFPSIDLLIKFKLSILLFLRSLSSSLLFWLSCSRILCFSLIFSLFKLLKIFSWIKK